MCEIRFYAELNDFLAPRRRGRSTRHLPAPHESLKHAIESLGVPHTEVGLVLVDGEPASLDRRPLREGERIAVYPRWQSIAPLPQQPPPSAFIADAHLGRLARYLRFAGFDTLYHDSGSDTELAAEAAAEHRTVLTRDRDLLMHRDIRHGCYLRAVEPLAQLREVATTLRLDLQASRTSRCLLCNQPLQPVAKDEVAHRLPPRTLAEFNDFWRCAACDRVYWRGSHWGRMRQALQGLA